MLPEFDRNYRSNIVYAAGSVKDPLENDKNDWIEMEKV